MHIGWRMGISRALSLQFEEETPDRFLRRLGFDSGGLAAKSARKAFLLADRRLSVTQIGDAKQPEYIVVEHVEGAVYRALVQTLNRDRVERAIAGWKSANLKAAAASY